MSKLRDTVLKIINQATYPEITEEEATEAILQAVRDVVDKAFDNVEKHSNTHDDYLEDSYDERCRADLLEKLK